MTLSLQSIVYGQQQIPNFQLEDIDNNTIHFNELKGSKLTIIDFWATWCKPCVMSIPELVKIQEEYKNKGVNIVGVSTDGPRSVSKVAPLTKQLHVNYPILLDFNNEVTRDMNVTSFPTLLIVNEENKVVYFHEGFTHGDEVEIRKFLDQILAK